jgi:ubiquinone/menaquinone biosynthesis C-methylase UbiE
LEAAQWADDEGVLVADLIPEGWKASDVLALLHQTHPIDYAQKPFVPGISGGVAVVVHESILQRHPEPDPQLGLLGWLHFAQELKRFAPWESALVIAQGWHRPSPLLDAPDHRAAIKKRFAAGFNQAKWATPILFLLFAWVFSYSIWGGMGLLLLWMSQPALILGFNSSFKSNWFAYSLFRPVLDLKSWFTLFGPITPDPNTPPQPSDFIETYTSLLDQGTDAFFEERRITCPWCESNQLTTQMTVPDFYQNKPGQFSLDQCRTCDHIFQNPRLSLDGLNFYYRDFYDGLGEAGMDLVFGASEVSYRQRVAMIRANGAPRTWLDVGGGHGHFALIAKHLLPQTQFDVLDLSESVVIAENRGWIRKGIKGLFPETIEPLKGHYDGVSMSHYLEHTRDPKDEIQAASAILNPGGLLMIEVPDPESKFGRLLKSYWLPWFQPQHQHFVSVANLTTLLEDEGFEVIDLDRSAAHQSVDFFFAALILIQKWAPDPSRPWMIESKKEKRWMGLKRGLCFTVGLPLLIAGTIVDRLARSFFSRPYWSNTYRILGKKQNHTSEALNTSDEG